MKFLFILSLLINIVFFLWEFNEGALDEYLYSGKPEKEVKQILLLSEAKKHQEKVKLLVSMNKIKGKMSTIPSAAITDSNQTIQKRNAEVIVPTSVKRSIAKVSNSDGSNNKNELNKILETQSINKYNVAAQPVVKRRLSKYVANIKHNGTIKKYCYQIGPFLSDQAISEWGDKNNLDPQLFIKLAPDSPANSNFLVYYPAAETLAKSEENVLILKKNGIADFWLFRSGELKGIISLGLFAKRNRAEMLQQELKAKGLKTKIMKRKNPLTEVYAQIASNDENLKRMLLFSEKQKLSVCE